MPCCTNIHALGLVRLKRKYGIRVMAEHEEQTFKQIKPDATWVSAQAQRIFQLFPLPHGLQCGGVLKLLKDHDWAVKPLQPGKGSGDAMSWQVGAATPPPSDIITGLGKEILITEITREGKPVPPPKLKHRPKPSNICVKPQLPHPLLLQHQKAILGCFLTWPTEATCDAQDSKSRQEPAQRSHRQLER